MTKLVQAAHSESLKSSAPSPFEEGEWLEVLQAMEEAYTQSLQYQTEIEEKIWRLTRPTSLSSASFPPCRIC